MCAQFAQWNLISQRHQELAHALSDVALDKSKRRVMQQEFAHLSQLLSQHEAIEQTKKEIDQAQLQAQGEADAEFAQLFRDEVVELQAKLDREQQKLDDLIAPPSEHDERSVYIEIRAGAGGQEAALFVANLLKMYTNYALQKDWRANVESESLTDLGGYREVVLHIQGKGAFGLLKYESGVHRVQRVPSTETQGRVHTSTATVAVLPEAQEVDVAIDPSDLRIDVFRSSGAGGQHVNTTDSAVRITHIPTGVVVSCQDERSQHKNKAKAMKVLQSRILSAQIEKQQAEMSLLRKEQVGTGQRAEKVRTYNFPQNRVTDHQVDMTLKKLDMVMEGDLGDLIDALSEKEREDRKKQFLAKYH